MAVSSCGRMTSLGSMATSAHPVVLRKYRARRRWPRFNLAGIDVGELLLDPEDIIISSATTATAVTDNILAADPGMTLTLDVATINDLDMDLTLAASNTITVSAAISKTTGNLSLIAGGNLTITADISNGTNTLILTAGFESGTGDLAACPTCILTASTLSLTQDSAFGSSAPFMFAAGTLNLTTAADQTYRGWMAATDRNLSIDATGLVITIGVAEIDLGAGNLTLSARLHDYTHASGLTIRVGDFSHSGTFQTADLVSISTPLLVFADGNITLDTAFGLSNRLELRADADGDGMGMITSTLSSLGAGSVLLQQAGAFGATSLFSGATVSGAATFRITGMGVDQVIHPWMAGLGRTDFSLRGVDAEGARAAVVLTSITLPAALTYTGDIDLQAAAIALTAATTTLTGGAISLTGVINETGSDARNLTINASGILTLNSDITLPTGGITGRLEITAFRVNLPSAIALAPSRLFIVFNDPAAVDFEASFDGAGVAGSTFPGIVSDIIRTIFTYAPRDCGGEAVCELTSMDNVDEIGQGFRLSPMLTANDSIMIRAERSDLIFSGTEAISITAPIVSIQARSINIGGRNFTITANGGTLTLAANITTTGDITLSSTGMNAGITLMFNIELAGRDISLTGAIDEPSGATNSFVATASRRLTLNDNINVGTNGLGLTGTGGITLANAAGLTLRGGAVRLTGVVTADNTPLTIEAQDGIVINNNIDIGAGRLELIAGLGDGGTAFINVHDARPDPDDDTVRLTITAGSFLWAQDAQFNADDTPPATFMLPDEVRIEGIYFGTLSPVNNPAWLDVRQFQGVRYMLGDGMGDVVVPQAATSALESITLNAAADSTISFGGTGAITLTAPQITITAGTIIIGEGRTLTITAEGGTLTLNLDDIIISGSATAGSVTLSAAAIVNDAALILNVATVNIAQDGEFGAAAPFTFPAGVTTLNLSTQAAQAYRDWMTAPNPGPDRSVSLMSAGVITVGQSINLETGNLSLNGTGGIVLGGGNIGLAGNTVILTGAIDEAATSTDNLTIAAVDDITLNSNIDLGMGALRLTAGIGSPDGDIVNGGTAPEIMAGSLHLQTDTALNFNDLVCHLLRVLRGLVDIRFGTAVAVQALSSSNRLADKFGSAVIYPSGA